MSETIMDGINLIHHVEYNELPVIGIDETNERSEKGGRIQYRRVNEDAEDWHHCIFLRDTDGRDIALYAPDAISEQP